MYNRFYSGDTPLDYSKTIDDYKKYRSVIQRMMGNLYKVGHIFEFRNDVNKSSWYSKDDYKEKSESSKDNKNLYKKVNKSTILSVILIDSWSEFMIK